MGFQSLPQPEELSLRCRLLEIMGKWGAEEQKLGEYGVEGGGGGGGTTSEAEGRWNLRLNSA